MREPLEIVTASRMQNMVEIRKKNTCFVTILHFRFFEKVLLGLSAFRAPTVGLLYMDIYPAVLSFGEPPIRHRW